jgi:perosamine synthetase
VPFRVVLLCEGVRQLMEYAERHAIQARSFFYPLHQQPCFRHLDHSQGGQYDLDDRQYRHAIDGYARGVLLPVFPTLTEGQVEYICATIRGFYAERVCV